MFNLFNTSRKFRGGENRKTEIQNEGWGGGGFLFMYLSTIICNGGQRGWGSWDAPMPLPCCPRSLPQGDGYLYTLPL